jgi:hypothetical protein
MPLDFDHPEFRFRSLREWDRVEVPTNEYIQLYCPETQTLVSFAGDEVQDSKGSDLEPLAKAVLASRKAAYIEMSKQAGEPAVIEREGIEPHESALAWMIVFHGQRPRRNFVDYLGVVTRRKILHMLVETRVSFAHNRPDMFQEILAGFAPRMP